MEAVFRTETSNAVPSMTISKTDNRPVKSGQQNGKDNNGVFIGYCKLNCHMRAIELAEDATCII